jgi:hypothetical protein
MPTEAYERIKAKILKEFAHSFECKDALERFAELMAIASVPAEPA